jgi:enterochelin esterase-like enzyme
MKKRILLFHLLLLVSSALFTQGERSTIIHEVIESKSIQNNPGGEDASRHIAIYLPPGYQSTSKRYPVVYWAHGFGRTPADSIFYDMNQWQGLLDKAIAKNIISPIIMVFVDNTTEFWGSNYANSELTGHWEDLMAREVVDHIDSNYKTLSKKESRTIAGFSMGGYGALRLAMRNPEVYGSVYAHSPAMGALTHGFSLANLRSFQIAAKAHAKTDLTNDFMARAIIAYGRTFTPNLDKPPFFCDLPISTEDDEATIHDDVLQKWHDNTLVELVEDNIAGLRMLSGIKFDWGRYDIPYIKESCQTLTNKLLSYRIFHHAEEYNGGHGIPKFTDDGPYLTEMLPFFMEKLSFE